MAFTIAIVGLTACSAEAPAKPVLQSKAQLVVSSQVYQAHVVPTDMTVQEKKQRFKALVYPALDEVYTELMVQYQQVVVAVELQQLNPAIIKLQKKYGVSDNQALLAAIKPHPKSIALAQAAMESAWATSRFFTEANNIFGVWSFDENEARIAAGQKRGDKTVWVKKYPSIKASVKDYYQLLAKRNAFAEFRALKMQTDDPFLLVGKLDNYSERGADYGKELSSMIRYNKFYNFDS